MESRSSIQQQGQMAEAVWNRLRNEDKRRGKSHWEGYGRYKERKDWLKIGEGTRQKIAFLRRLTERTLPSANELVFLEWGPGGGSNAVAMSGLCARFIGVDISQSNLEECRRQLSCTENAPEFIEIKVSGRPARDLPQRDLPSVDLFFSTAVFQHFPSKAYAKEVLLALKRITASDAIGFIQIRFDNGNPKFRTIDDIAEYGEKYTTACSFAIDEFNDLVKKIGFDVLAVRDINSKNNYATFYLAKRLT